MRRAFMRIATDGDMDMANYDNRIVSDDSLISLAARGDFGGRTTLAKRIRKLRSTGQNQSAKSLVAKVKSRRAAPRLLPNFVRVID